MIGLIALVAMGFAFSRAPAQNTPKSQTEVSANIPDLSGVWNRKVVRSASGVYADEFGGVPLLGFMKQEPPLQGEALEAFRANRKGVTDARLKGRDELDPLVACFPPGPTRIFAEPRPFEIRQTPQTVYILSELDHWVRRIYVNGTEPNGFPPTWMGYSVGKYNGNTFVVDTRDVDDRTWVDGLGTPHSDALHVVERYRRLNHDTLEVEFTFEDSKAYTKSWSGKKVFQLEPAGFQMKDEVICEDYRKLGLRKDGYEFIKP